MSTSSAFVTSSATSATASETLSSVKATKRGLPEVDVVLKYFSSLVLSLRGAGREGRSLHWLACTCEKQSGLERRRACGDTFHVQNYYSAAGSLVQTTVNLYDTSTLCFYETQP